MDKVQRIIEILNNKRDGTVHGAFMGEIAAELATIRAENERLRERILAAEWVLKIARPESGYWDRYDKEDLK